MEYDAIVVGGGHAGIEASLAASRMGMHVLMVTFSRARIGCLSCNPAVGGVGKGQLVKEIDALGGEMGRAADACSLQFRILNRSKGSAVWSSRAQVDSGAYPLYMQKVISSFPSIEILEGEVSSLILKDGCACGVEVGGNARYRSRTVILAPGTFLNGTIHVGLSNYSGGRMEDTGSSISLSAQLSNLGFDILRFKTGTCARLDGSTIDFSGLEVQYGDNPPVPFSLSTGRLNLSQMACYMTYTNGETHRIIRENLHRSPLFSGVIKGRGVRYCPSLEDKVVKFPHHQRHHVFLEPEGRDACRYYPNGISTSLPEDVQDEFIRTIRGLENVRIARYGYGIEHDVVEPTQIYPTTETRKVGRLFLAGQINGTTGYEEAAAQGLVAGINAALAVRGEPAFILERSDSYIGVLLDDLSFRGTPEPYRMFTSRVEYRLILREDNAGLRLREKGYRLGLVSKQEWEKIMGRKRELAVLIEELKSSETVVGSGKVSFFDLLRKPGRCIGALPLGKKYDEDVLLQAEIEARYAPYARRMLAGIEDMKDMEKVRIPPDADYSAIPGLSLEVREKLARSRPLTLGQAGRISGITPAAIAVLAVFFGKKKKRGIKDSGGSPGKNEEKKTC